MSGDKRPIVGFRLARGRGSAPVRITEAIGEPAGRLVELVLVGRWAANLRRRGHERKRRGSRHLLWAEDAAEERAEADATATELEARPQGAHRYEIVEAPLQLANVFQSCAPQLDIPSRRATRRSLTRRPRLRKSATTSDRSGREWAARGPAGSPSTRLDTVTRCPRHREQARLTHATSSDIA